MATHSPSPASVTPDDGGFAPPTAPTAVPDARRERLTRHFQGRLVLVLGLRRAPYKVRAVARWLLKPLAAAAARTMTTFDDMALQHGLPHASRWLLSRLAARLDVQGAAHIPAHGPLLIVFNHPASTAVDVPALLAHLPRHDARVPGKPHAIGDALASVRALRIHVPPDAAGRTATLRAVVAHLRAGGCVLMCPAGNIEPDPAHDLSAATTALGAWSASPRLLAQQVPGLTVVPACVSSTLNLRLWQHPWLRRALMDDDARLWTTLVLHWLLPPARNITLRVAFGAPLPSDDARALPGHIHAAMHTLMHQAHAHGPLTAPQTLR